MLKRLLVNIIKVFLFAFSFVAYWYSLDEKYYLYREQKIKAEREMDRDAV